MANLLQRDGLTIELLEKLSYKSELGINLKRNLHYFEKESLFEELIKINEWYDEFQELFELASVGVQLRKLYESAKIQTEQDFKEEMKRVLSDC